MPTAKITQTYINELPVPDKPYWVLDSILPDLRLYVGKKSRVYYLRYKAANGKTNMYKIGAAEKFTPIQVREIAKKMMADMTVTGQDLKQLRQHEGSVTLRQLKDAYDKAGGSKFTTRTAECFAKYYDLPVDELTPLKISSWRVAEKASTKNRDKTINTKIEALKTLLNFGVENHLIAANPLSGLKKLKETDSDKKTRYLTPEENERFWKVLDAMDQNARAARQRSRQHARGQKLPSMEGWTFASFFKPLVIVAANTGIRRHALFALKWGDVDLDHASITLRASSAKSRKTDIIPINKTVCETLTWWRAQRKDDNPLIFPSPKTGGILNNCKREWETLMKKANIEHFRWHDMRHNFASQLVMAGVDLNTVRELMTHGNITMTLRYAHLAPSKTKEAVEKLDPPKKDIKK